MTPRRMGARSKGMVVPTAACPATFSKSLSGSASWRNTQRNPAPSASRKANIENPASASRRPTTSKIASCWGRRSASSPASPRARTRLSVGGSVAGVSGSAFEGSVVRNWVNPASANRSGRREPAVSGLAPNDFRMPPNPRRDLLHRKELGQSHAEGHGRLYDATLHSTLQRRKVILPTSYSRGRPPFRTDAGTPDHPGHG